MQSTPNDQHQPLVNFQMKIGGEAGFGVMAVGQMFSKLCTRSGKWTFEYPEYPSLISGGHNTDQVLVHNEPVFSPIRDVHLLLALNQETIDAHRNELAPGAGVIFDPDAPGMNVDALRKEGMRLFPIPLERLAHEAGGERARNVIAFAVAAGILNARRSIVESVIRDTFGDKGEAVVQMDLRAADLAYQYAETHSSSDFPWLLDFHEAEKRINITGNVAIALGALQARCAFYVAYPMTPATSILTYLAKVGEQFGMVVRHAEDEIGVINEAIGAGYTGVRAMAGTSGGGFALMTEAVGLAGELEVPCVIVNAQRPGPATGLPTWTAQGDLQFVLHAGQGESPRIILAPGDVRECFHMTFHAFNLAEKYQMPVFILTDKFLGESATTTELFSIPHARYHRGEIARNPQEDGSGFFPRYQNTPTGVSPRTLPGTPGGTHIANSDEHDEYGNVSEDAKNRVIMMDKRMRKIETALQDIAAPVRYGPRSAALTIITWGSTKGPALDALRRLNADGDNVNVLHFSYLFPLPKARVQSALRECVKTLMIEGNATGQFAALLKEQIGFVPEATMRKYDGRPFFPHEIIAEATSLLQHR